MDKEQLKQIIAKCKTGDKQAFKVLMLNFSEYVFRLAFRILGNEEDAKDIVQETFLRVWKHIGEYKEEIKITTWMYKIATNLCLDKLRINKRSNMISEMESERVFNRLSSDNLNENIENRQLAELIIQLSKNLTPKQKVVFVLKDIEGMETNEIEKITGMDNVQIKSNLHLARLQIRKQLIQMAYEVR